MFPFGAWRESQSRGCGGGRGREGNGIDDVVAVVFVSRSNHTLVDVVPSSPTNLDGREESIDGAMMKVGVVGVDACRCHRR